ncbi:Chromosome partition protein Smc [Aquisphaera giovannonii]|uniref:Chromosome partition protein Smc n=1 Tax=Aquisphaera giovannonii TaxID=406548 RepID=A0A5B9W515_9BACT|nr:YhaN family protein [Aquisphaera giovannonii]QEH35255.1 Chromosome partition protein Smc [Aquisphaera giovannonii]
MKILELSLLAFGPFTDVTLDLSAGSEGLHVVYGPNEAGKSSSLRALQQALFGIPVRSSDNFIHAHTSMRVGMAVRSRSGEELRFVRRKGLRATLLAADGETALKDESLSPFLKGLGEAEFQGRFALGHDELVQGGKAILEGGGDLGAMLFQAGGGLKDLMGVQRELDGELEGLFKPSGQKPRINAGLAAIKEAEEARKSHSLRSAEWVENEAKLREATARLAEIEARLADDRAARRRLDRLKEALPILARRHAASGELDALGDVPALGESFAKERDDARRGLESAGLAIRRARSEIDGLERRAEGLSAPAGLLAEADAIDRLREAMGAARKARAELPDEEARLRLSLRDARDRVAESWPDLIDDRGREPDLESLRAAADRLKLTRSQKATIQRLATERAKLDAARQQAAAAVADLEARHEAERAELDRLPPPADASPLELALKQARDQGDLDAAIDAARERLAQAERQAARSLAGLPLWAGPMDALAAARVPGVETIERADGELGRVEADREQLRRDLRKAAEEKAEAEAAVERLRRVAGDVPGEDDLRRDRDARDALWSRVREGWEARRPPGPGEADAFEEASSRADATADRLRRELDRVVQHANAQAGLHKAARRIELLSAQEADLGRREAEARARWEGAWGGLAAPPLSPREMLGWLDTREKVLGRAAEVEALRRELEAMEARRDRLRDRLRELLSIDAAPATVTSRPPLLSPDRDRAEAELKRLAGVESRRARLAESSAGLARQLEAERSRVVALDGQLAAWRGQWARAVEPLGLAADATEEDAQDLMARAAELAAGLAAAAEARERIEGRRRELGRFAADVRATCRRAAADLDPGEAADPASIEAAAQELLRRLREAEEVETERKAVRKQLDGERARLRDAEHAAAEASRRLEALCREAGCDDAAQLPDIERRSARAARLREDLRERDEQLEGLRGGEPPDAFRAAALALDVDRLPEQIRELDDRIAALEVERDSLNQALGRHREILSKMDGSSRAAEAAEAAEELKARLALDVEEYARLRLAAEVLRQSIERYRERSQGPVIDRASELFRRLTLGSFDRVKVDYDEHDRAVLRAVRAGGAAVDVEGLSLGTADQLYLALRLASLDAYLERHEPIPFVVDDILIQFDDDRAAAALGILADLSRRTQVILFTHHGRICDLAGAAASAAGEGVVFLHRLHELKAQAASKAEAEPDAEPPGELFKLNRGRGRKR